MIFNPDKFKWISIQKSNQTSKPKQFLIGNDVVEVASSVNLLGIHIDDKLSFNLHITSICKSASKQLNPLMPVGNKKVTHTLTMFKVFV